MKRSLTIALALFTSVAVAQPAERMPPAPSASKKAKSRRPKPEKQRPVDPYADPAPADPYGAPASKRPKAKAKSKVKVKSKVGEAQGRGQAPADPYAILPRPVPAAEPMVVPAGTSAPAAPGAAVAKRPGTPLPSAVPSRVGIGDLTAVQGLLAVQRLDGWLLFDRDGENPIAAHLVAPAGNPSRPWFYLLPARGEPIALVHTSEQRSFEHLPGTQLTYTGYRDLDKQLKVMLKGVRSVAIEYSPKAAVPSVSRVDAGTVERLRAAGVKVRSSETLLQFTKAIWGEAGRTAHHIAVHHLVELRKDALAFVAKAVQRGQAITEYDVQQRLARGAVMRGLAVEPPVVAAGINTADPYYVPTAAKAAPIKRGDLLVLTLAVKLDKPEGVWAKQTWVAMVDVTVAEPYRKAFETVSLARDQALSLIADRARKRRAIRGAEVDDATRAFIAKSGLAANVMHRTGHSIDTDLQGSGADLDNYEVKDTRILTPGTGVTVGPGVYFKGAFGVRAEVSVYLSPTGPEVTTPAQDDIEPLLDR